MTETILSDLEILACPRCRGPLRQDGDRLDCPADDLVFPLVSGCYDLIDPSRRESLAPFLDHYAAVRRGEGWGTADPAYYLALPFRDVTGRFPHLWRIRARSFSCLSKLFDPPPGGAGQKPRVLDLGAGNGWLSNRLTAMGFESWAVDISADPLDGLGALTRYECTIPGVLAEFDHLPFQAGTFDLAIFNASLHYAADPGQAIRSVLRVLEGSGRIFMVDSPIYASHESGVEMVREMRARLTRDLCLKEWVQPGPGFVTFDQLEEWTTAAGLDLCLHRPLYGLRW